MADQITPEDIERHMKTLIASAQEANDYLNKRSDRLELVAKKLRRGVIRIWSGGFFAGVVLTGLAWALFG